jgi:hypothetical protein
LSQDRSLSQKQESRDPNYPWGACVIAKRKAPVETGAEKYLKRTDRVLVSVAISTVAAIAASTAAAESAAASSTSAAEPAPATTAAAVPATAAAAAAAATTAAGALFTRTCFVDGQRPAVVLLAIEGRDCRLRFLIIGHFHEPEPLTAASVPIVDDLGRHHLTVG